MYLEKVKYVYQQSSYHSTGFAYFKSRTGVCEMCEDIIIIIFYKLLL